MTPSKRTWTVSDVVYSIGFIYLHILMQKVIFRRSHELEGSAFI